MINLEDRVKPVFITDNETKERYELDFSRESVKFAEARGFEIDSVATFPATKIPELFFYAFRKNHRKMARANTDALMESMNGLSGALLERLIQLYQQAGLSHVIQTDEEAEKNSAVTVEL